MINCEKDINELLSSLECLIKEDQKGEYLKLSESLRMNLGGSLRCQNPDTGKYSRFSEADRKDMFAMYLSGSTYSLIAAKYHCSVSYAAKIVGDMTWKKRKQLWSFLDIKDDELRIL